MGGIICDHHAWPFYTISVFTATHSCDRKVNRAKWTAFTIFSVKEANLTGIYTPMYITKANADVGL
jgi:hypothetical protein